MLAELAAQGAGLVGGLIGGKMQSDAIKHAQKIAQGQAVAADLERKATLNQVTQMQAPGVAAYYTGLNALTGRLGLNGTGVTQAITEATTPREGFDPKAFLEAHPEVRAAFEKANPNNLRNNLGIEATPEAYATWFYETQGKYNPGYQVAAAGPSPITGQTAGAPNSSAVGATQQQTNALTGTAMPTSAAAATGNPGTFGNASNPTYTAPPAYQAPAEFSFDYDGFKDNPAYQLAQQEGMNSVLASSAATGAMRSGAALKELQDRGQKTAYQFYQPERDFAYGAYKDNRDFGYNQYLNDRNFGRATYENDRNYLSQRYDQGTNDIFRLTGLGENALRTTTNAVQGNGDASAQMHTDLGNMNAQAALQKGDIWSGLVTNFAGMASNALSGLGGSGSGSATGDRSAPVNGVTYQVNPFKF